MNTDLLAQLLQAVDEPLIRYDRLNRYYEGRQPLAYLSAEARKALEGRFTLVNANICKLAVCSLAERLRLVGVKGADVWGELVRLDIDEIADIVHREALTLGESYVIVWTDSRGRVQVTPEAASSMAVIRDAGSRVITSAVKRWVTPENTELVVYLPDEIVKLRGTVNARTANDFHVYDRFDNPLGVVPVVAFTNSDRFNEHGCSELDDLAPLVDGLVATLAGLAVAVEFHARPRRWATGIELVERPRLDDDGNTVTDPDTDEPIVDAVSPIPESNRAMISENPEAKFGQLEGSSLAAYSEAVRVWLGMIQAVSSLPAHYVGVMSDQPTSADALRSAESALAARASARSKTFARSWEQVCRLVVAIRDGVDVADVDPRVVWSDFASRSEAQLSDSVQKLFTAGLLSRTGALIRMGYTADEAEAERAAIRAEALDKQGFDLAAGEE